MGMYDLLVNQLGIEKCPECDCSVGDDTNYRPFSNRSIVVCAQCGTEIVLPEPLEWTPPETTPLAALQALVGILRMQEHEIERANIVCWREVITAEKSIKDNS